MTQADNQPKCACGGFYEDSGAFVHADRCMFEQRMAFRRALGIVPIAPGHLLDSKTGVDAGSYIVSEPLTVEAVRERAVDINDCLGVAPNSAIDALLGLALAAYGRRDGLEEALSHIRGKT